MANYLIQPKTVYDLDPNDTTSSVLTLGLSEPGAITGLTNGIEYVARELILSSPSVPFVPLAFNLTITGLSTDASGPYAPIDENLSIGYDATDLQDSPIVLDSIKWSDSANPSDIATYGTGPNPSNYNASLNNTVWLHGFLGVDIVSKSFVVRTTINTFVLDGGQIVMTAPYENIVAFIISGNDIIQEGT